MSPAIHCLSDGKYCKAIESMLTVDRQTLSTQSSNWLLRQITSSYLTILSWLDRGSWCFSSNLYRHLSWVTLSRLAFRLVVFSMPNISSKISPANFAYKTSNRPLMLQSNMLFFRQILIVFCDGIHEFHLDFATTSIVEWTVIGFGKRVPSWSVEYTNKFW